MPSRNDAPGLKARRRADGRIVWYWVAAQCSRKPALTQHIEIIGHRSDGRSRYGLITPQAAAARQNGASHG